MTTLGVIVGNRGFFPAHLCKTGRKIVLDVLKEQGIKAVIPPATATRKGAVESLAEARLWADYFKQHADKIDGVLITLPNFGDERAIANTLRWSGLNVPVLVHAFTDDSGRMTLSDRRDSFCGKMSCCNNLRQYGVKFSLTDLHTVDPTDEAFAADLQAFAATCRVVKALKNARLGQIGARPAAFNTVRYSEKLLERSGISIETLDLSELLGWANGLKDGDASVRNKLAAIKAYTNVGAIPAPALMKMAKLGVSIDKWVADQNLTGTAIQCWTSLEEFYGVVPCTCMSMMSNALLPSACETDITGLIGMVALQAAAGRPAALLDWNNNYGNDPDKGVLFHCSNLPKDVFCSTAMDYQAIIGGTVGKENAYGTIVGRIQPGPFTFARVSTDDLTASICAYVGEGAFTDDPLETFGGYGVFHVPGLQDLLAFICQNGFEHHTAITRAEVAASVDEALSKYLGWDVYYHEGECCCDQ
jgi:L-fucose isomerase-like protein